MQADTKIILAKGKQNNETLLAAKDNMKRPPLMNAKRGFTV